jgi:hypothetical protein
VFAPSKQVKQRALSGSISHSQILDLAQKIIGGKRSSLFFGGVGDAEN